MLVRYSITISDQHLEQSYEKAQFDGEAFARQDEEGIICVPYLYSDTKVRALPAWSGGRPWGPEA